MIIPKVRRRQQARFFDLDGLNNFLTILDSKDFISMENFLVPGNAGAYPWGIGSYCDYVLTIVTYFALVEVSTESEAIKDVPED